jgi:UDP-N-acetylmuramyl pentapeptide synthase
MTSQVARLYALVTGIVVFFLAWAGVAAHPWAPQATQAPQIAALAARQQQVQLESLRVKRIVDARWAKYRLQLAANKTTAAAQTVAATPSVRVVNLPPLVVTRTS